MNPSDIEHRFAFHAAPDEEKRNEHTSVRNRCRGLADALNDRLPEGREKSLAITHLEEVMFWANAALARNQVLDYEPLLPDHRLARIEGRLRREFPSLREEAQFVTFIQPPTFTKSEAGVDVPIPAVAVFAVTEPNPRHPGYAEITPVNIWLSTWRDEEKANRHSSDVKADPAYRLYRLGVAAHCERLSNLRSMN